MSDNKVPALVTVLGGQFENQRDAFDALDAEAKKRGILYDLDDVDVIREASEVRLAHYFRPAIVARIEEARGTDDTVILLFASALTSAPDFPPDESELRLVGRFAGRVVSRPLF